MSAKMLYVRLHYWHEAKSAQFPNLMSILSLPQIPCIGSSISVVDSRDHKREAIYFRVAHVCYNTDVNGNFSDASVFVEDDL